MRDNQKVPVVLDFQGLQLLHEGTGFIPFVHIVAEVADVVHHDCVALQGEGRFLGTFLAVPVDGLLGDAKDLGGRGHVDAFRVLLHDCILYRFGDRLGDGGFQHFFEEGLKHIVG